MLKKWLVLRAPDANTEGNSSTPSDDKGADSSQQEPAAEEQVKESAEAEEQPNSEESATDATGEEKTGDQVNDQSKEKEVEENKQEDEVIVPLDKPEDAKLPFHKHPRFQEVINEKNAVKQEYEKAKPLVEQASTLNSFMQENQISPQEFQSALQYLQALRRDPMAAFKMLQPTYEQLAQFAGESLPTDLQAEVAAGTLPLERAKQIARAQAQERYNGVQKQWQTNGAQQQQGDFVSQATGLWVQSKTALDPDLKQGTPLWEQTDLRLKALPAPKNAQEAMANCEKAYADAKKFLGTLQPRQAPRQQKGGLSSKQTASGNNGQVMKTAEDVMNAIKRGTRPTQMRYS